MTSGPYSEQDVLNLATSAYEQDEAGFSIITGKCALIVIDMQDEFIKPHWSPDWVPAGTRMVPQLKGLIDKCRQFSIPVIYTAFADTHKGFDRPGSIKFMPIAHPNADYDRSPYFKDGKIYDALEPMPDDIIIYKPSYGAFYDTPLETILKNMEKDTLIISGTLTNFCCSTTARQAYERGYKVVFGSDVTAADLPEMHEAELKVMRKGFARVMSAAEITADIEKYG
ncbi:MAG: cysteine hydrolase [Desulfobacteraceae bacterium]|nr:cysteine hydrolase [Desulfobacteraceae bacterium]